jgi:calcyclin binding protein
MASTGESAGCSADAGLAMRPAELNTWRPFHGVQVQQRLLPLPRSPRRPPRADAAADAAELRRLAALTERASVRALLEAEAAKRDAAAEASAPSPAAVAPPPPPPIATPTPQPVSAPVAVTASSSSSSSAVQWTEPKYGFDAEGEFVEVLVLDLPGVGGLPREQVTCDFTATSFDLRVVGLGGKNYRVFVPALDKEVVPGGSKLVVGKNRVTVKLKKVNSYDYWTQLKSKKGGAGGGGGKKAPGAASASSAAADPMGGLMDLMKDMYEDGDDATKKMIAEAWTKSREQQPGGGGGGLGGGFGGAGGFGAGGLDDDF